MFAAVGMPATMSMPAKNSSLVWGWDSIAFFITSPMTLQAKYGR